MVTASSWTLLGGQFSVFWSEMCTGYFSPHLLRYCSYACPSVYFGCLLFGWFLLIADGRENCSYAQNTLITLLRTLGFTVNWDKLIFPTTRVKFLGLIIDSVKERVELPEDKVLDLIGKTSQMAYRRKVSRAEMEVLCGHLIFASRSGHVASTFTRIFLDAMNSLREDSHRLRISVLLRDELLWWSSIAPHSNGLCPYSPGRQRRLFTVSTDKLINLSDVFLFVRLNIQLAQYFSVSLVTQ